jgi:hypothetical protein
MPRKSLVALVAVLVFGAAFAAPAQAQSQAVSFNIGYFSIRGIDGRVPGDVLAAELAGTSIVAGTDLSDALLFRLKDFNTATFGGEWLIGLGDFLEGGVGIAYYSRSVLSSYANLTNQADDSEIVQTLRLRIVPITATVRFLPLGRRNVVEPYIGGGVGVFLWRYSEAGQFIDPSNANIFVANPPYVATGTNAGPVILGGARIPFGKYAIGGEIRWQKATGTLPTEQFVSDAIDLGGLTIQATFVVRFGGK